MSDGSDLSPFFHRLEEIARSPSLLVASDFDGTIAPIVSAPSLAIPHPQSMAALAELSKLPGTHVAIVSGRALCDLAVYARGIDRAHLVGSHGAEVQSGSSAPLAAEALARLEGLKIELRGLARSHPGFLLEEKPASVALHYRHVEEPVAAAVIREVLIGPGSRRGVYVREGKKVLELTVVDVNKGVALQRLRRSLAVSAALFLGDDLTDEDVFALLEPQDVGIKVGPGPSRAYYRVRDTNEVARVLAKTAELRRRGAADEQ